MIVNDISKLPLGFDVVVVGAGAAGATVAANLKSDLKVLLIDSKTFPRKKACSGILVSEGREFFGDLLDKSVLQEPNVMDIEYQDWDNNKVKFSKKDFLNTDRFLLDKFLMESVKSRDNVYFLGNTRLLEFTKAQDNKHSVVIIQSNSEMRSVVTRFIVGCDGAISQVRKKISSKEIPFYIGVQEFIKTDVDLPHAYFIFDNELTDFYAWVIPKKPFAEVGALLSPVDVKQKFDLFKSKVKDKFGISGSGVYNSAIVLRPASPNDVIIGKNNVLLCGEAAGLISPSSAEGISYALRSGKFCAAAINKNFDDPLIEYSKLIKPVINRLGGKFKKSSVISNKEKRNLLF